MKNISPKSLFTMVLGFFTSGIIFLIMGMGVVKEGILHMAFLILGVVLLVTTLLLNKRYLNSTKEDKRDDN